ncbi:MAG: alpha/beta hydrolase [Leptolyngbyaceae bacterium]|nr:alpha/beta hydrolase [Leptolyngbyaceae bacterium]
MFNSVQTLACWVKRHVAQLLPAGSLVCASLGAGLLLSPIEAEAAERLVLSYGPFERYLTVDELQALAETGEASPSIKFVSSLSSQEVSTFRDIFTQEIQLSLRFLDRTLNSLPGEYALYQAGSIIHTPSRRANIQAMRAAFVLSASDDDRVSLLEVIENYPTQDMYLDGYQLLRDYRAVSNFVGDVEERLAPTIAVVQEILEGLICDCESEDALSENALSEDALDDATAVSAE